MREGKGRRPDACRDGAAGAQVGALLAGHADRARDWMERALLVDPDNLSMRYNFACALAAFMGEKEQALRHLERSLANASAFHLALVEADPDLDTLREEPRYKAMINKAKKRLGIDEAEVAI